MPTFNQLVRKGREKVTYKSTSPAMQKGLNTLKNKETDQRGERMPLHFITLMYYKSLFFSQKSLTNFVKYANI